MAKTAEKHHTINVDDDAIVLHLHDASGKEFGRLQIFTSAIPHSDQKIWNMKLFSPADILLEENGQGKLVEKDNKGDSLQIHLFPKHPRVDATD